jgi:hypothetical protein
MLTVLAAIWGVSTIAICSLAWYELRAHRRERHKL